MSTNYSARSDVRLDWWLKDTTSQLASVGISTPRLDALVLLEDLLDKDRAWLLAHPEMVIKTHKLRLLDKQLQQRLKHTPLAYIRGKTEFYGREFLLNKRVLEPRPESETMIDVLKGLSLPSNTIIIDIGTGSGALGITAKLELPDMTVIATDIDKHCLEVAQQNAKKHRISLTFLRGDLLEAIESVPFQNSALVLLANLPYVPTQYHINQAAHMEPRRAIFGGKDGLNLYRRFFKQMTDSNFSVQYILTEALPFQHEALAMLAQHANFGLQKEDDFIQLFGLL